MTVIPSEESYKSSASDMRQKRQEGLASFIMEGACLLELRKRIVKQKGRAWPKIVGAAST